MAFYAHVAVHGNEITCVPRNAPKYNAYDHDHMRVPFLGLGELATDNRQQPYGERLGRSIDRSISRGPGALVPPEASRLVTLPERSQHRP